MNKENTQTQITLLSCRYLGHGPPCLLHVCILGVKPSTFQVGGKRHRAHSRAKAEVFDAGEIQTLLHTCVHGGV